MNDWEDNVMLIKKGSGWKACFDSENGRYFGEYGGIQDYHLFEITKEIFDRLDKKCGRVRRAA